jgi:hypothetical protein
LRRNISETMGTNIINFHSTVLLNG